MKTKTSGSELIDLILTTAIIETKLGLIRLEADEEFLYALHFVEQRLCPNKRPTPLLRSVIKQLGEYFDGKRKDFDIPVSAAGTVFQQSVWEKLREIPYGSTITYGELAQQIGDPDAARAVGTANGCNPISIVIPCHRVIGGNGKLVGYAGGLWRKQWLLEHEASFTGGKQITMFL